MKDITYRYSVQLTIRSGYVTPAGWATRAARGRYLPPYLVGPPTDAKLARYVDDYNQSLQPNGVNAHLGDNATCTAAVVRDHKTNKIVARWNNA